jgi:hypothetical protein
MASSLRDLVSAIAPTIPPNLISPQALSAIGAVAQQFPLMLSTTVGFERPLHTATAEADFFLRVSSDWGKSVLAGHLPEPPILEQLYADSSPLPKEFERLWTHPVWQRLQQLADFWHQPNAHLHTTIEDVWLEFDTDSDEADPPIPSSFFGIAPAGAASLDWVRQIALPTLLGDRLSPETDAALQTCFSHIVAPASLYQVGLLSGRTSAATAGQPAVRLYIRDLSLAHVQSLLKRLQWSGDIDLLMQMIDRTCGRHSRHALQLEVGKSLSPKIAVECYLSDRAAWQRALSRLVTTGFCIPEVATALLDYPGYVRAQDEIAPFPDLLSRWTTQLAPYRECLLMKRLAYLKFTYEPGQPLLAKAYLGLLPTWVDARYLSPTLPSFEPTSEQEATAITLCKALIQQLDYGEIDVEGLFPCQRSQKAEWLNRAINTLCVGN